MDRRDAPGLDEDPDRKRDEDDAVRECRQDLGALVAEAPFRRTWPAGEPNGHERQRERGVVGEHVRGVRQQREAAGEQAADDLDRREGKCQAEDDRQRAAIAGSDFGEMGHGLRVCAAMDVRELMKLEVDPAEVEAVYELWKQHSKAEDDGTSAGY